MKLIRGIVRCPSVKNAPQPEQPSCGVENYCLLRLRHTIDIQRMPVQIHIVHASAEGGEIAVAGQLPLGIRGELDGVTE